MAAKRTTKAPPEKRRFRRRLTLLLVPLILSVVVWKAVESYVDIERYRSLIDKELELLLELPLAFGAMDLRLLPSPRLVVKEVVLGEAGFMASSPRVTVTADLGKLIHRELDLQLVTLHELRVDLPEDTGALQERWQAYMLALETPDPSTGAPMLKVTLESITGEGVQVFRGDHHYATGNLVVTGVTAGAPEFGFDIDGVGVPGEPAANGAFVLTVDSEPLLQGSATISNIPLANLTGDHALPPFLLDGQVAYAQAQNGAWTFDADGMVMFEGEQDELGDYAVEARYASDSLHVDSLHIATKPVEFDGSLSMPADGSWALDIQSAVLRNRGIDWLADRVPGIPFADNPAVTSEGTLTAMRLGEQQGAGFAIEKGAIAVAGVDLVLGSLLVLPEMNGLGTVNGETITIDTLVSQHLVVEGDVQTDFATDTIHVNLSGGVALLPDLPLPKGVSEAFRSEGGTIEVGQLHASFHGQELDFPSLVLEATLQNARVAAWDEAAAEFVAAPEMTGGIAIRDGVLHLAELAGADSLVTATVTPDESLERWAFEGSLESDLASPIWKPLFPSAALTVNQGELDCTSLSGVVVLDTRAVEEFAVEADVRGLDAGIQTEGFEDRLQVDSIAIAGTHDALAVALNGSSERLGPIRADGTVRLPDGDVSGTLTLSPTRAGGISQDLKEGLGGRLLAQLSPLPLEIKYGSASGLLEFSAVDPIPLSGTLSFRSGSSSQASMAFAVASTMPASWLFNEIPELDAAGTIDVQAQLTPSDGTINVAVDARNTEVSWGQLRKKTGAALALALNGAWGADGPSLDRGRLQLLDQEVAFDLDGTGIASDGFTMALAKFTPLLPEGVSLGGTVTGSIAGGFSTATFGLESITYQQSAEAPRLALSGTVHRARDRWEARALQWAVANSAGTADLARQGGAWSGAIHGNRLNIDDLSRAYDAVRQPGGAGTIKPSDAELSTAKISVTADTLSLAGVALKDARCTIESQRDELNVRGFTFVYGEGTGGGRLKYRPGRDGARDTVDAEFQLLQVDARFVEELFIEDERGFEGKLDGSAVLRVTLPPRGESYLNHMSGKVTFNAVDGTLGKAGLASKLLTSLRTTDVLRLRIPHLRDRGLTFKSLSGEIAIETGVFHVAPFSMADSTYILEAGARIDFPSDTADGEVQVQVLEGVTGVVGKIPILGEAASLMNKVFSVPIKVTGTASDPGFRVGMPG